MREKGDQAADLALTSTCPVLSNRLTTQVPTFGGGGGRWSRLLLGEMRADESSGWHLRPGSLEPGPACVATHLGCDAAPACTM